MKLAPPAFALVCLFTYFPYQVGSLIPALAIVGAVFVFALKKGA